MGILFCSDRWTAAREFEDIRVAETWHEGRVRFSGLVRGIDNAGWYEIAFCILYEKDAACVGGMETVS
jgi:hypothetical protein